MEIAILVTLIVGFIITWIVCSKPVSESDWKDLEPTPMAIMPIRDYESERLRVENRFLERKIYDLQRELEYRKYAGWDLQALRKILERPVEVNVDVNIENN